jgi:hypothetical protein
MGLINLQTDLKSLKFGKDRPGGGNSGQPFIQTPIPDNQSDSTPLSVYDSLLRGGVQAPQRALTDVKRLTKYLFNPKSPSGLLFITKENLLSRTSVKTEASKGFAYAGGSINAGVYTPLSTLAQAGVGYLGIHLNQKGIDPTGLLPGLRLNKYEDVARKNNAANKNSLSTNLPISIQVIGVTGITGGVGAFGNLNTINIPSLVTGKATNRLLKIYKNRYFSSNNFASVLEPYSGGPGSILGVGKTRIRFADQRTGVNNLLAKSDGTNKKYFYKGGIRLHKLDENSEINYTRYLGASTSQGLTLSENNINPSGKLIESPYKKIGGTPNNIIIKQSSDIKVNNPRQVELKKDNLLKNISENSKYKSVGLKNDQYADGKDDILAFDISSTSGSLVDKIESQTSKKSREEKRDVKLDKNPILKNISENPDYNILNLDNTEYTTGKEDIITFDPRSTKGKLIDKIESSNSVKSRYNTRKADGKRYGFISEEHPGYTKPGTSSSKFVDKGDIVNSTPLYKSLSGEDYVNNLNRSTDNDDLIPFRIGIIDPNNPSGELVYMNFRSYIDSFSDSYSADWKAQSYMGRGEKFYKYGGFDRSISLAFTVVSQTEKEVGTVYSKLNYLASSLAPTYTPLGYMAGNICKMTVGDYIYEQYGFISSLTYDVPQEASWDIQDKLFTSELGGVENERLPYMIKVNGIKFTPIHNFRPEIAQIFTTDDSGNIIAQSTNPTQRYITNKISLG